MVKMGISSYCAPGISRIFKGLEVSCVRREVCNKWKDEI